MLDRAQSRTWAALMFGIILGLVLPARANDVVYTQAPNPAGGQIKSAWYAPDGLDGDQYVWDAFILTSSTPITEVQWRGAYTNYLSGAGKSPVYDFTVAIYPSIAGGSQPDVVHAPLVRYHTNGNAGESLAGTFGGVLMYDYHFTLPSPFQAVGGTKYWIQIEAYQGVTPTYGWPPDWSLAASVGGDGNYFRSITGANYAMITGDTAFTLLTTSAPSYTISASVTPAGTGSVLGAGNYPSGTLATLTATPNAGFGFVEWTESGTRVSTNATYKFTVTKNRTLVARFVDAYTISTVAFPIYGGTTAGDGTFNAGSSVTVSATPRPGFLFQAWREAGTPVSTSPSYTFTATAGRALSADFVPGPLTVTFDLDSGVPLPLAQMTSTPFNVTYQGVTAWFSSPQDGGLYQPAFSLQTDATTQQHQTHLSGNYLWPDSVYRNDLTIHFSQPLTSVSLDFATVEMEPWANTPSPLVVRAYLDSTSNPPVGSAQSSGVYGSTLYPEGVLVFSSASPFNLITLAVGNNPYGTVDFMADNVSVGLLCSAVVVDAQPQATSTCPQGSGAFGFGVNPAGRMNFRWQRETAPNSGVFEDLLDGPTAPWDGQAPGIGGLVSGSGTDTLVVAADLANGLRLSSAHAIRYRCAAAGPCGSVTSDPALLTVCAADFNCDGFTDIYDFTDFVTCFEGGTCPAGATADFNNDGFADIYDFTDFVTAFETGC